MATCTGCGEVGFLRRLLGDTPGRPVTLRLDNRATAPEPDWLNPDYHDGSPFLIQRGEADWQGDEARMLTRRLDLTTATGAILRSSNCSISRWPKLGLFHFKVTGESHRDPRVLAEAAVGSPAVLVPEPTSEFDAKAIKVETGSGAHVGYVPASQTDRVRKVMKDQPLKAVFWAQHLRNGRDVVGLEVMLWCPDRIDGLDEVPNHPHWDQ